MRSELEPNRIAARGPARYWLRLRVGPATETSDELSIGAATVKSHVSSILTKLGLRDRAQVVLFEYESGLVEAGNRDIGH